MERMGYQDIKVMPATLHQIAHHHLNCGEFGPAEVIVQDLEASGGVIPMHLKKRLDMWEV